MIDFSDHGNIHSIDEYKDEKGKEWWVINGSTYYPREKYSLAEAKADFQSEKSIAERADFLYRSWCD